jgi:hypothetical protein
MNYSHTPNLITLGNAFEDAFRQLADGAPLEAGLATQVPADGFDPALAQQAAGRARRWAARAAALAAQAPETKPWSARAKARARRAENAVASLEDWEGNMRGGVFTAPDPDAQKAYDDARDRVERLMRNAIADGDLSLWDVDTLMPAVADRDEWKRSGIASGYGLRTELDDLLCPGPAALVGKRLGVRQGGVRGLAGEDGLAEQQGQARPAT